jgi:SNF2 family DNA or RNA helicase
MCDRGSMLVAYDLGLGKTVLTIAAIERLMDSEKITEPGLVICLSSLKYQWAQQITKFTSGTSVPLVIDGTPKQRADQYSKALNWETERVDYIILNYEQVVNDWDIIKKLPKGFIVTDEATAIKSFKSKRSKYVKKLKSDYKFALTGTPVENGKPEELFSIMQFVDPEVLGRFDLFDNTFIVRNQFGGVERYRNLTVLNERLKTACVRKRQEDPDVAPHLPDTIFSEPVLVNLDSASKKLYNRIKDDLMLDLEDALDTYGGSFDLFTHYSGSDQGGHMDSLRGAIMSELTALRMLCDHPELLKISARKFKSGKATVVKDDNTTGTISIPGLNGGSSYLSGLDDLGYLDNLKKTPKLDALTAYVKDFLTEYDGNKIVIFTSYVDMVDLISAALPFKSVKYTGQMNAKEKDSAKLKFQETADVRIFVSSDAGGYGVDLPQANLLINYDLPWNAGLAVQRNGRIRRASSEWSHVVIQDILIANSIEERQHAMLTQKKNVANAVVDGEGIDNKGGVALTAGSLRGFLKEIQL